MAQLSVADRIFPAVMLAMVLVNHTLGVSHAFFDRRMTRAVVPVKSWAGVATPRSMHSALHAENGDSVANPLVDELSDMT